MNKIKLCTLTQDLNDYIKYVRKCKETIEIVFDSGLYYEKLHTFQNEIDYHLCILINRYNKIHNDYYYKNICDIDVISILSDSIFVKFYITSIKYNQQVRPIYTNFINNSTHFNALW